MKKLTADDLMKLEEYAQARDAFRAKVMVHKKHRRVAIGPHMTLYFEDRITIQYQIQEMLRIEKIFERAGIQEELDAYNPLIPDGSNLKAVLMIEYEDVDERRDALTKMIGIEDQIWVRVGEQDRVFAIADEDLDRENDVKTSAVHFLRFELTAEMAAEVKRGGSVRLGCEHAAYRYDSGLLDELTRARLAADLTEVH